MIIIVDYQKNYLWSLSITFDKSLPILNLCIPIISIDSNKVVGIFESINDLNRDYCFFRFFYKSLNGENVIFMDRDIPIIDESAIGAFCYTDAKIMLGFVDDNYILISNKLEGEV